MHVLKLFFNIMICGMDNLFVLCWFLTNNDQYIMMVLLLCAGDNGVNVMMMMMISVLHQMWSWHFRDGYLHSMSQPPPLPLSHDPAKICEVTDG